MRWSLHLALGLIPLGLVLPLAGEAEAGEINYQSAKQGGFVVALSRDARGHLWSGTEDNGVSRYDGQKWQSFGVKDGLGDANAYAIASDRLGRVWVGHLNHGVSVWNGQSWKNYGVLEGPLGERVFAIATSPSDGDVWMATNAGLSRYSLKNETWTHYTRATGLPTIEISCLAFDALGRIYVGTQCEGLLIGSPNDDFASWREIRGAQSLPLSPSGEGLPSNFINDILITDDETFYVATDTGLAKSGDFGETWTFLRGLNWEEKIKGLWKPKKSQPPAGNFGRELLREDYVTALAEDERGLVWIGYRMKGYEVRRPLVDRTPFLSPVGKGTFPYISTLLPLGDGSVALGYYNAGIKTSETVPAFAPTQAEQKALKARRGWKQTFDPKLPVAPFPKAATQTSKSELERLLAIMNARPKTPANSALAALPEDWTTQGDWLGRYGRYWGDLCAMISPQDLLWGAGQQRVEYKWNLGPHIKGDDSTRYWVHWLQTNSRRALEMPPMYGDSRLVKGFETDVNKLRRQSEVDDHGEDYPLSHDGPHLRCVLKIPQGDFVLSLYNHNKDGHDGSNRARDYKISIRPHQAGKSLGDTSDFESQPELMRSRQRDFWGGVWKRFYVRGPQELTLEVNRNYSFNTIMAGVFLDTLEDEPYPYFNLPVGLNESTGSEASRAQKLNVDLPANDAAENLWAALERARQDDPQWWAVSNRPFYCALARYYQEARLRTPTSEMNKMWVRLGACYRALGMMQQWEETQVRRGLVPARQIEKSIKWDGRFDDRGAGFESVVAYSTAQAGLNWWEKNKNDFVKEVKAETK